MRKYNRIQLPVILASVVYSLAALMTISCSASMSVLNGDDFTYHAEPASGFFTSVPVAWSFMTKSYLLWQGTFFSKFLSQFLNPISGDGLSRLRIVMFFNAFLFTVSLFLFVWTAARRILKEPLHIRLLLCSLALFCLFNLQTYADVFFGFTSAMTYTVPLTCALLGATAFIVLRETGKTRFMVPATVLVFLSAGGVLMISGALCLFLLLVVFHDRLKTKQWNRKCSIVFLSAFISSLINALAPGNFVRHSTVDGSSGPLSALLYSVKFGYLEAEALFSETVLLVILLVTLVTGVVRYRAGLRLMERNSFRFMLAGGFIPLISLFPLLLGNNGAGIPERGKLVFDLLLMLWLAYCFYHAGFFLAGVFSPDGQKKAPALSMLALIILCVMSLNRVTLLELPQYIMFRNLATGRYRSYYQEVLDLFDRLSVDSETDPVITLGDAPDCYQGLLITNDPLDYFNHSMACYFGKNSVRLSE